jgi:hypothetical protein
VTLTDEAGLIVAVAVLESAPPKLTAARGAPKVTAKASARAKRR